MRNFRNEVWNNVWYKTSKDVWNEVIIEVRKKVSSKVWNDYWNQVSKDVWNNIRKRS